MAEYPAIDLSFPLDENTPGLLELLHAALDDFAPLAIHDHESGDGWRVFFRHARDRDAARHALARGFTDRGVRLRHVDVPDDGWAKRCQAQLTPVRVGNIVVAPPWAADAVPDGCTLVVVEPSTGFGTGHHATTRLCLSLLQSVDVSGGDVIDLGTGSGVLAIAAVKLGASNATGVDVDPDALQSARENIARNGVERRAQAIESDVAAFVHPPAAVVLANLTASALQREAGHLRRLVAPAGHLIVSGFTPSELPAIEAALGWRASTALTEAGWAAAVFDGGRR